LRNGWKREFFEVPFTPSQTAEGIIGGTRTVEQAVAKGQQGESLLFFRSALWQRQLALKVIGNMLSQHF
jgi:hypothetical protein